MRDVHQLAKLVRLEEDGELDIVVLASKLNAVGYRVYLRSALGGGHGADCFHRLRNEFLVVAGSSDTDYADFVVESQFRHHFAIPHATECYAALFQAIPDEIVAPASALAPLVQLLCSELSLAFAQMGLSLPPWRHSKSLLSKWLPSKARDLEMGSPGGSPRAASPEGGAMLSALSSGAFTPSAFSEDDSPRAVLRDAPTPLAARPALRMGLKPRSLLSANLAASAAPPRRSPSRRGDAGQQAPMPAPGPGEGTCGASTGWITPPIRRVRMQGHAH